jgi:hypothetical protein
MQIPFAQNALCTPIFVQSIPQWLESGSPQWLSVDSGRWHQAGSLVSLVEAQATYPGDEQSHTWFLQTPPVHTWPHAPQLWVSFEMSTHWVELPTGHDRKPVPQVQAPCTQVELMSVQSTPQWLGSASPQWVELVRGR